MIREATLNSSKGKTGTSASELPAAHCDHSRRGFIKAGLMVGTAASGLLASGRVSAEQVAGHEMLRPKELDEPTRIPLAKIQFPMTGAHVFAKACKEEGVGALFCCPGNYKVIHAMAEQGTQVISGCTDLAMAAAADAFIRVTGEIAATSGTEGPGLTTMICAIANANAARTPLLVLASNMAFKDEDTEAGIQLGYQQPITEGMKKYGKRLVAPQRVHEYAGYAFRQLRTGIPRPVHLDFTQEVTNTRFKDASELAFYHDKAKYRSESKPHPNPADLKASADLLRNAKRPIIVSSTGVFSIRAWDALRQVAEKGNIPVVESGPMRGQFSDDHPLSASRAPAALSSADLVVLVGQYCMPTVGEYAFGPEARYIRIEPAGEDIGRNLPIDLGIVADERATLEALASEPIGADRGAWLAEVQAARVKFEEENETIYKLGAANTDAVHPAVIAKHLAEFLQNRDIPKEQTTIIQGGFGIARYTRRWLRAYRPGQIVNGAYQYGPIGLDVGYAVGAAAALQIGAGLPSPYKGTPVVAITGDARFGYSGMEIATLATYRMPAVIIVYNNKSLGSWYPSSNQTHHAPLHLFQENVRYDKMAEALGGRGEYVTRPQDFLPALQRACRLQSQKACRWS